MPCGFLASVTDVEIAQCSHRFLVLITSAELLNLVSIIMNLSETLKLLRVKENEPGYLLEDALSVRRYWQQSNSQILRSSDAFYLPAVNSKARIKSGRIFIGEIFRFFDMGGNDD
jgi:hypothetical protein